MKSDGEATAEKSGDEPDTLHNNCVRDKGTKSIKPAELFYKTESLLCVKRFVPMQYQPRLTIGVEINKGVVAVKRGPKF